jgi:hypothetical protein
MPPPVPRSVTALRAGSPHILAGASPRHSGVAVGFGFPLYFGPPAYDPPPIHYPPAAFYPPPAYPAGPQRDGVPPPSQWPSQPAPSCDAGLVIDPKERPVSSRSACHERDARGLPIWGDAT